MFIEHTAILMGIVTFHNGKNNVKLEHPINQ